MKNRLYFIPAAVIVVSLLFVGTFCDLQISQAIVHLDNPFSHFMAGFTVMPVSVVLGFILGTLFKMVTNKQYKKAWQNIILCVISFGLLIGGAYFLGDHFTSYHAYNIKTLRPLLNIAFGLAMMIPGYILGYIFYDKMNHKHIFKTYILIVATVVFLIAFIEISKVLFPRVRYTSVVKLLNEEGVNYFRPWYLTDFSLSKEFVTSKGLVSPEEIKSFPSGHSNMGIAATFTLMFIPKFFPKLKGKEVYFFYGGFLFFLLVAFSRIYIGAHYLSDTMFAGTVALLVYFISNEIYLRKIQGGLL